MPDDIDRHSIDLLSSVWHLMDLTPEGRDDWYADVSYHERNVLPNDDLAGSGSPLPRIGTLKPPGCETQSAPCIRCVSWQGAVRSIA